MQKASQLAVKAVPIGGPPWHERRNRSLSQSRVLFEVPEEEWPELVHKLPPKKLNG